MTNAAQPSGLKPGSRAGLALEPAESANRGKIFIIALRCGRLANRLTLFANFVALAAEEGHRVMDFTFHSYAGMLETTRRDIYCQYPVPRRRSWIDITPGLAPMIRALRLFYRLSRPLRRLNERGLIGGKRLMTLKETPGAAFTDLEGPEFHHRIEGARTVLVHGWNFRAPNYLRRQAREVRAYFRPAAKCELASRNAVQPLREQAEVVVGVHIRHRDYREWRGGKYYFPIERYARWMGEFAAQFPGRKVAFLVCSDETRQAEEFPGLAVGLGAGSPMGDLYALAQCDYLLGPVSSFSQWASFYGNVPLLQVAASEDRLDRARFRVSFLEEIPQ